MDLANSDEHLPALKPLRISKSRRKVDHGRTNAVSAVNNTGPPCSVPRRHSSYAIRSSTPRSVAAARNDITATRRDQHHSDSPGYNIRNSPQTMEQVDLAPKPRADAKRHASNGAPKGGIFTRAMQALDFRSRQSSGNGVDDKGVSTRGMRSSTYPKSLLLSGKKSNADLKRHTRLNETDKSIDEFLGISQPSTRQITPQISPPPPDGSLHVDKTRARGSARPVQRTPFTMASMKLAVDALKTRAGQDLSTWISIVITAKINGLDEPPPLDVPLDVMILVDNSAQITPEALKGACRNAFQVAVCLDRLVDRLAVGCISSDPTQQLNILMPLCSYNLDTVRRIFRSLPAFQLQHDESSHARFTGAIREASSFLLRHSSRGALRHVFLVTARSTIHISEDGSGNQLRFHTISPENTVVMNTEKTIEGWHIPTSFDDDEGSYVEPVFKGKLKQAVDHLRMGIDSGYLCDLSVDFQTGVGTEIEAVLGDTERKTLRLGESWTMLVKVKAITESGYASSGEDENTNYLGDGGRRRTVPTVDDMIDHLQGMLNPDSNMAEFHTILAATLDYKHSFLPSHTAMKTKGKCEVARFPQIINCNYNNDDSPGSRCTTSVIRNHTGFGEYDQQGTVKVKKRLHLGDRDVCLGGWSVDTACDTNNALAEISPNITFPMPPGSLKSPLGSMNPFRDLVFKGDEAVRPPFAPGNFRRSKHPFHSEEALVPIH